MTALPRGTCQRCGVDVAIRRNGTAREHADPKSSAGRKCAGSGLPAVPYFEQLELA